MRARAPVVAALLVLGLAGCSDPGTPAPDATGLPSAEPAPASPATPEAATTDAPEEPTSSAWTVPDVPDQLARGVITGGGGESVISGAVERGESLQVRVACLGESPGVRAEYALLDAREGSKGTPAERTFLTGTVRCDGQEHEGGMEPAGFSGPVQVMFTRADRVVEGYAILTSS